MTHGQQCRNEIYGKLCVIGDTLGWVGVKGIEDYTRALVTKENQDEIVWKVLF